MKASLAMAVRVSQKYVIGIVGGLGPRAHIDLEQKLLEAARSRVGASSDQEFPEWLLSSVPATPDRSQALAGEGPDPFEHLVESLRRISGSGGIRGADFAIIACNTAHHYLRRLRSVAAIPIADMVEETAAAVAVNIGRCRVGVLATTGTLRSGLYHRALGQRGLEAVSLLDLEGGEALQRNLIMRAIYGDSTCGDKEEHREGCGLKEIGANSWSQGLVEAAVESLRRDAGIGLLILACSELALAMPSPTSTGGLQLIDPARVLADVAVDVAYGFRDLGAL